MELQKRWMGFGWWRVEMWIVVDAWRWHQETGGGSHASAQRGPSQASNGPKHSSTRTSTSTSTSTKDEQEVPVLKKLVHQVRRRERSGGEREREKKKR